MKDFHCFASMEDGDQVYRVYWNRNVETKKGVLVEQEFRIHTGNICERVRGSPLAHERKYDAVGSGPVAMNDNGTLLFLLSDHLGSSRVTYNPATMEAKYQKYLPYGEVRGGEGNGLETEYTFTGQFSYADQFGLVYFNARWYDPALGRFSEADTLVPGGGIPMAFDRYLFVFGNPLRYTDPSGHDPQCALVLDGQCVVMKNGSQITTHSPQINQYQTTYISSGVGSPAALDGEYGIGAQYIRVPSLLYFKKYGDQDHLNLCGHLSLAAILESVMGANMLGMIWEKYSTAPSEQAWLEYLVGAVNSIPGWSAERRDLNWRDPYGDLLHILESGDYVVLNALLDRQTGRLVDQANLNMIGVVEHWVVVIGASNRNVYVYNPFVNSIQVYTIDQFGGFQIVAIIVRYLPSSISSGASEHAIH